MFKGYRVSVLQDEKSYGDGCVVIVVNVLNVTELYLKMAQMALTHVAQLVGHCPTKLKVTGSIPS